MKTTEHYVSWSRSIYRDPSETRELIDWILSNEHEESVMRFRRGRTKKDKLPVILPAGIFEDGKTMKNFVESSGLIFIDIDGKSNNIKRIRPRLDAKWIKMITQSSSGTGLSVFIPIDANRITTSEYPRRIYAAYYNQVEYMFKQAGIITDPACKNINRLRYASFDPKPYLNPKAEKFPFIELKEKEEAPKIYKANSKAKQEIIDAINLIDKKKIDISARYNDWLYIAGFLNNVFGMNHGLELFLKVSRHYPGFDEDEAERKYMHCLSFTDSMPDRFFNLIGTKIKMHTKKTKP
jgi:hypothetical protein